MNPINEWIPPTDPPTSPQRRLKLKPKQNSSNCPLCKEELSGNKYTCPSCQTSYHTDCAEEMGGCATLGCAQKGKMVNARTQDQTDRVLASLKRENKRWYNHLKMLRNHPGNQQLFKNAIEHFRRNMVAGNHPLPGPTYDDSNDGLCKCSLCRPTPETT